MKAEERKHLKENAFQEWVGRAWKSVTSGSTANTIVWSAILIGLVAIIAWRYYSNAAFVARSAAWLALDNANTVDALKSIIAENKNSTVGRTARFHLTRYQIQDSLSRLAGPNLPERVSAADELVAARDAYRELARESGIEATLTQEAMMNIAKAEETLAGVPKADSDTEMRGSLGQALQLYQELAAKYPNSFWGGQAAARAKQIEDRRTQIEAFYIALAKEHGKPAPPPPLPEPTKPEPPKPEPAKP
jgi:hypothetical protein